MNGSASNLASLVNQDASLVPILMTATLARRQSIVQRQGGVQQVLQAYGVSSGDDSDVARNNAFLLEQFVRSILRVMPGSPWWRGTRAAGTAREPTPTSMTAWR